jgi:hypothetical protein
MEQKLLGIPVVLDETVPRGEIRIRHSDGYRKPRDLSALRDKLGLICRVVWGERPKPGEHLWSIPVDLERDFDIMFADAFDELEQLRRRNDEAVDALRMMLKAYDSILPGIAGIAVDDYAVLNDAPIAARKAIAKAEGK